MKLMISFIFVFFSLSAFSQGLINFNRCKDSLEPAVCSAKLLSLQINELKGHIGVSRVLPGIYTYNKGYEGTLVGRRKIKVDGSLVKYFGSNGDLFTTFQCYPGKRLCRSNEKHMLVIMNGNEFFIDWNDDSNGHYKWVAHNKKRPL